MTEYKPLRPAQRRELERLIAQRDIAETQLKAFTNYLAADLEASTADGWTRLDPEQGFVRQVETSDTDS